MTALSRGWLEPGRTDPGLGLRAEVADPVWFLVRQWELGELQGEDASSPVAVIHSPEHVPLRYGPDRPELDPSRPVLDPTVIPAEALVEAEPGDWWTVGRRARLGRAVGGKLDPDEAAQYRFGTMPAPYAELADAIDGRAVFLAGVLAGDPVWSEVPSPPPDRFSTATLTYRAPFAAGDIPLEVHEHRGGDLDWFSVRVDPQPPLRLPTQMPPPEAREVVPTRLTFPGAPHPRWWQIEDVAVDPGAFSPDRSHLASMLRCDLAVTHAEDWFVFPVSPALPASGNALEPTPPTSGVLVRVGASVEVRDSFGKTWSLQPPDGWSMFQVHGLGPTELVVWPIAVAPQAGPLLDDIVLGVDEDANLAWALELRADQRALLEDTETTDAVAETSRTGTRDFRYQPMTTLPEHWHPYVRGREWRQAVLADLSGPLPRPRPGPVSRLIGGPSGPGVGRGHALSSTAVPSSGVRLRRRAMLARDTDGHPVLWVERSVLPVTGPPTSHLRWDVMVEAATDDPDSKASP
jgi:hypothetical protein